nr:ribonuclease H-like YkuK family protein [Sediminibacillus albus]
MNLSEKDMSFDEVFQRIIRFIEKDPAANYRLMVGTDSQVHKLHTVFVTGIVIQRQGKGAWACVIPTVFPRKYMNLHEKISMETSLTEQVAFLFDDKKKNQLIDMILPHIYQGSSLTLEGHIDVGLEKRSLSRFLAGEMMARIESSGLEPVVKPESFVASGYANRYTKTPSKFLS